MLVCVHVRMCGGVNHGQQIVVIVSVPAAPDTTQKAEPTRAEPSRQPRRTEPSRAEYTPTFFFGLLIGSGIRRFACSHATPVVGPE